MSIAVVEGLYDMIFEAFPDREICFNCILAPVLFSPVYGLLADVHHQLVRHVASIRRLIHIFMPKHYTVTAEKDDHHPLERFEVGEYLFEDHDGCVGAAQHNERDDIEDVAGEEIVDVGKDEGQEDEEGECDDDGRFFGKHGQGAAEGIEGPLFFRIP